MARGYKVRRGKGGRITGVLQIGRGLRKSSQRGREKVKKPLTLTLSRRERGDVEGPRAAVAASNRFSAKCKMQSEKCKMRGTSQVALQRSWTLQFAFFLCVVPNMHHAHKPQPKAPTNSSREGRDVEGPRPDPLPEGEGSKRH